MLPSLPVILFLAVSPGLRSSNPTVAASTRVLARPEALPALGLDRSDLSGAVQLDHRRFDARGAAAPRTQLLAHSAGLPLTGPSPLPPEDIAREFLAERTATPASGEFILLSVVEGGGGVRFASFEQRFDGVPVALSRTDIAVAADGSVLAARIGELAPAPPPPAPDRRAALADPELARAAGLAALGLAYAPVAALGPVRQVVFEGVLLATSTGARRAVRVRGPLGGDGARPVELLLDEQTGDLLRRDVRSFNAVDGANVFRVDPVRGREFVSFPHPVLRPSVHSPAGWDDANSTSGNNVIATLDREADFFTTPGAEGQAIGVPPVFDPPYTGDPAQDADLALANAFTLLNLAHDRFRALGLDEASGAMQADNFGRGGRGGDQMYALVQYGAYDNRTASNFVSMGTSADGNFTFMQLGLFSDPADPGNPERRDAALEADLLVHEYAHGVSIRLVGDDPACFGGVQPQAISEGWSDFLAASFTNDPVIGGWTAFNELAGHRRFSLDDNRFSLFNFCAGGCNRTFDGDIWAGTLWDLRRSLVSARGAAVAVPLVERLVVEAMRYTPCRPTFAQAAGALLVADSALTAGANRCVIAAALAGRGLGASLVTTGPDDQTPVPAFDLPPECSGGAAVRFDRAEYALDAEGTVEVVEAGLAPGATVTVTSSGGDVETLALVSVGAGPAARAVVVVRPAAGAPVLGDGIVSVTDGESLTAVRGAASAMAGVSGRLVLSVVRHYVYGSCDDDRVNGFYTLPGFLDAGEVANIVVTLGVLTPDDLEDATITVTSTNPLVRVLPSGPVVAGTLRGRRGDGPREFEWEVRAEASPSVTSGMTADVRFDVTGRGRTGSATLTLALNMDYLLEAGRSSFAGLAETFDVGSPTAGAWTHEARRGPEDFWSLEPCAGRNASAGVQNGSAACGPYVDGQVAASLVSPPLMGVPVDAVAWRLTDFGWANDVRLWTDPANPYCDADMVGVFLTTDPSSLPFDDGANVYNYGPQRVYLFTNNTPAYTASGSYGFDNGPQAILPGVPYDQVRLAWVFWGDVFDCGFETSNTGHYRLDDVRFTYDIVREVPGTTTCAADCVLMTSVAPVQGTVLCAGDPLTLSASLTQSNGCPGQVYLVYLEDGVDLSGGVTDLTFDVPGGAEPSAVYAVYAWCEPTPTCADYREMRLVDAAAPGVGGPWADSLRVVRDGGDLVLTWRGAAAPPAYGVYRATTRAELAAGVGGFALHRAVDAEGTLGEGAARLVGGATAAGLEYFDVRGRDRCTDEPRVP